MDVTSPEADSHRLKVTEFSDSERIDDDEDSKAPFDWSTHLFVLDHMSALKRAQKKRKLQSQGVNVIDLRHLPKRWRKRMENLLQSHKGAFAQSEFDIGKLKGACFRVELRDTP